MGWLVVVVLVVVGVWSLTRGRVLFVVSVRDGRVLVVSGRVPGRLVQEFKDIVGREPVRRATITARAGADGGQLSVSGVDEGTAQRLRNVFHLFPISQLRNAPPIAKPTFGQWLGIGWLAWLFDRSQARR